MASCASSSERMQQILSVPDELAISLDPLWPRHGRASLVRHRDARSSVPRQVRKKNLADISYSANRKKFHRMRARQRGVVIIINLRPQRLACLERF
jgi:hypothetical protein